jgi:hypothetical protein
MPGHDAWRDNFNPDERAIGAWNVARLHRIWSVPGVLETIAAHGRVYIIGLDEVQALDARTGAPLRIFSLASLRLTGTRISPIGDSLQVLAYARRRLVVGTTTEVIALDPATGRQLWRVPDGASDLTVLGKTVYAHKGGCQNPCGGIGTWAIDYVDQRSFYQVRVVSRFAAVRGGPIEANQSTQTTYSKFNAPLHITPPRGGASRP